MHYIVTSLKFDGEIELKYNDNGVLILFHNRSKMSDNQLDWFMRHFPHKLEILHEIKVKSTMILTEYNINTDFDSFWETYNRKTARKRCEELWSKMKESDRVLCMKSLNHYNYFIQVSNRTKKDPDTYLRGHCWQDDWKGMAKSGR